MFCAGSCDAANRTTFPGVLAFKAFGVPVGVSTNDANVLSRLLKRLPPGSSPTSDKPERLYTLLVRNRTFGADELSANENDTQNEAAFVGLSLLARTANLGEVLEIFESDLQLHVAEMCADKVFVHAGVVRWNDKAIVVPGASCAGKTTLITALVRAGATYYSDEYALFDDEGRVHAYPRLPRIRTVEGKSRIEVHPQMFKPERELEPLRLGHIVVTEYSAGAEWQPRKLSRGQAILALMQNTVAIRRRPESCTSVLCRATQSAIGMQSARGEAEETALMILSEIERSARALSPARETLNTL